MECNGVFEDYISNCNDFIEINADFTANELITWIITDKFDNEYSGQTNTGVYGGQLLIPVDELPEGLLNQYVGTLRLQFFGSTYQCNKLNFVIGKQVDTIAFVVKGGNNQKPNLGC